MVLAFQVLFLLTYISQARKEHKCIHDSLQHDLTITEGLYTENNKGRILQSSYEYIRIAADYSNLVAPDTATYNYITQDLFPAAINYFSKALKVKPLTNNLTTGASTICGISTPVQYRTGSPGVAADILFFVKGTTDSTASYIATAGACSLDSVTNRPIFAQVNYNFAYVIGTNKLSDTALDSDIATTMHELTHAFGFSSNLYPRYIDSNGDILSSPSKQGTYNNYSTYYLDIPLLNQYVRTFFNCPTAYALLENQGGGGSLGSHWERRVFMNEYMTASAIPNTKVTNLTLTLLEATGWYKPDYSMAESIFWGQGQGCGFLDQTCLIDTATPRYSEFCAPITSDACSYDGLAKGFCGIPVRATSTVPYAFNYWGDGTTVSDSFVDNCPYAIGYANRYCTNPSTGSSVIAAEKRGINSRCFLAAIAATPNPTTKEALCLVANCTLLPNGNFALAIDLGFQLSCPAKGDVNVASNGYYGVFPCPDPNSFCLKLNPPHCKRDCMGKGLCYNAGNGVYKCYCDQGFYGDDCSLYNASVTSVYPFTINITGISNYSYPGINSRRDFYSQILIQTISTYPVECIWNFTNFTTGAIMMSGTSKSIFISALTFGIGQKVYFNAYCYNPDDRNSYQVLLQIKAPSLTLRLSANSVSAISSNLIATANCTPDFMTFRFGYYASLDDIELETPPYYGFPILFNETYSSLSSIATQNIILPSPEKNIETYYIVVIGVDADNYFSMAYTGVNVTKYTVSNISQIALQVWIPNVSNSMDILRISYLIASLMDFSNTTNADNIFWNNKLASSLCSINLNKDDYNIFVHSTRVLRILTQTAALVDSNQNSTLSIIGFLNMQYQFSNSMKDVNMVDEKLFNILSSIMISYNSNLTYNFTTNTDLSTIQNIVTLVENTGQKASNNISSGLQRKIFTEAFSTIITKSSSQQILEASDFNISDTNLTITMPILPNNYLSLGNISVCSTLWVSNPFSAFSDKAILSSIITLNYFTDNSIIAVSGLNDRISMKFFVNQSLYNPNKTEICQYWNTSTNDWDEIGCEKTSSTYSELQNTFVCECNHLTSFALGQVLASPYIQPSLQFKDYKALVMLVSINLLFILIWILGKYKDKSSLDERSDENPEDPKDIEKTKNFAPNCGQILDYMLSQSHAFFSLFTRYDYKLSRQSRAVILLTKYYLLLLIIVIIFHQIQIDSIDSGQMLYFLLFSFILCSPVTISLRALFRKYPNKEKKYVSTKGFYWGCGFSFFIIVVSLVLILITLLSETLKFNDLVFYAYLCQFIWDIFVNQLFKALVGLMLTYQPDGGCKDILATYFDCNISKTKYWRVELFKKKKEKLEERRKELDSRMDLYKDENVPSENTLPDENTRHKINMSFGNL